MKSVGYILWGLAIAALILVAFKTAMIWVAAPLLVLALSYSLQRACLYRPPEEHLGVIYRLARFSRFVNPDDWALVVPGLDEIREPVSLLLRQMEANLSDLLTQDQVPVDCELFVYYRLDPRHTDAYLRAQALQTPEDDWDLVIGSVLQEIANEVTSGIAFQQLLTPRGRRHLKRALSALLAERVRHLGLIINPKTGVSVQELKPTDSIWQAMIDRLAAVSLGEAALARVHPMLEELSRRHPEVAWAALLLEWAAVIAKDGTTPRVLVTPTMGPAHAVLRGNDQQEPIGRPDTEGIAADLNGEHEASVAWMSTPFGRVMSP